MDVSDDALIDGFVPPLLAVTRIAGKAHLLVASDEELLNFPVRRTGKKVALRFAGGVPGRRSTVWRLWGSPNSDDVYLASRQTAGEMKVSFHQSGDWRLATVPKTPVDLQHTHVTRTSHSGRVIHRWERPRSAKIGWTHGLTIITPGSHFSVIPGDDAKWEDVRWHAAPRRGMYLEFEIHFVNPGLGAYSYRRLIDEGGSLAVMDAIDLPGGEVIVVLALTTKPKRQEKAWVRCAARKADSELPDESRFSLSPGLGPRHLISVVDPTGRQLFYDLRTRSARLHWSTPWRWLKFGCRDRRDRND